MKCWARSWTPPLMSPPTRLGFRRSMSAGPMPLRARTRSRKPGANRSIWRSTASDTSSADPFGTWVYAQSTCFPAGARERSATVGCTASTYGCRGWRPAWTSASACAISVRVPPTWIVPARRTSGWVHGTGPSRAQSILNTPAP